MTRRAGSQRPGFCSTPSRSPPVPVDCTIKLSSKRAWVTFDRALTTATLDHLNWTLCYALSRKNINSATANATVVTLAWSTSSGSSDPDAVAYAPPPWDVLDDIGAPAQAFSGYPVHE